MDYRGKLYVSKLAVDVTAYALTAGSSNAYTLTLDPAPSAINEGLVIYFKVHTANTTTSTINVNALGTITIKKPDGSNVSSGDLATNQMVCCIYDGTNFVILSAIGAGGTGSSGFSGVSGFSGKSGYSGLSGYSGVSGFSGYSGVSGTSGFSGVSGFSGKSGYSGPSGFSGYSGKSGYSAFSGYSGVVLTLGTYTIANSGITSPGGVVVPDSGTYNTIEISVDSTVVTSNTLTINAPTGTLVDGKKLLIKIQNTNGSTALTLSLDSVFNLGDVTITSVVNSKTDYIGCVYNSINSKWDVIGYRKNY